MSPVNKAASNAAGRLSANGHTFPVDPSDKHFRKSASKIEKKKPVSLAATRESSRLRPVKEVTPFEARGKIQRKRAALVDIRSPEETAQGFPVIDERDVVALPWQNHQSAMSDHEPAGVEKTRLGNQLAQSLSDRGITPETVGSGSELVIACRAGRRSADAVQELVTNHSYPKRYVSSLKNGFEGPEGPTGKRDRNGWLNELGGYTVKTSTEILNTVSVPPGFTINIKHVEDLTRRMRGKLLSYLKEGNPGFEKPGSRLVVIGKPGDLSARQHDVFFLGEHRAEAAAEIGRRDSVIVKNLRQQGFNGAYLSELNAIEDAKTGEIKHVYANAVFAWGAEDIGKNLNGQQFHNNTRDFARQGVGGKPPAFKQIYFSRTSDRGLEQLNLTVSSASEQEGRRVSYERQLSGGLQLKSDIALPPSESR